MYKLIEESKVTSILGNFQSNYCILMFHNKINNNGMMHLAEHYLIKMIYKKRKLFLYGQTDIDYMYLFLRIPELFPYFLLEDINEICNTEISNAEFQESKEEVINEIQLSNNQTLEILNYVTDGFIKELPVGSMRKIYEVKCNEMKNFLKKNILNKFYPIYIGDSVRNPRVNFNVNKESSLDVSYPPLFENYKFLTIDSKYERVYVYFDYYHKNQEELDTYLLFKLIFFRYINIQENYQIFEKNINLNNKLVYFVLDNVVNYLHLFEMIHNFSRTMFIYIKKNLIDELRTRNSDLIDLSILIEKVVMYKCFKDSDIKMITDREKVITALENFDFNQMNYFIRKIFNKKYRVIILKKSGD